MVRQAHCFRNLFMLLLFYTMALAALVPATALAEEISGLSSAQVSGNRSVEAQASSPTAAAASVSAESVAFAPTAVQRESGLIAQSYGKISDVELVDLNGNSDGTLLGTYAGKSLVTIVGRESCSNTTNAVKQAQAMLKIAAFDDVQFVVLDCDNDLNAFKEFAPYESNRLRFYSSGGYNAWGWSMLAASGYSGSGCVMLPFIVISDAQGELVRVTTGSQDLLSLVKDALDVDYTAPSMTVQGQMRQSEARKLLDLVNAARSKAGASALKWDPALEETAIQRAVELGVFYSHTRPNGSRCFTAWPAGIASGAGENIAYGYQTSTAVNQAWTNSTGHYQNMIESDAKSMAAACFRDVDGRLHWVECFSGAEGGGMSAAALDGTVSRKVPVDAEFSSVCLDASGAEDQQLLLKVGDGITLFPYGIEGGRLIGGEFSWTSSKPSVVSVAADGSISAKGTGTALITAKLKELPAISATMKVTVRKPSLTAVTLEATSASYNGQVRKPVVKQVKSGTTSVPAGGYIVSYLNAKGVEVSAPKDAGTYYVKVTGQGIYNGSAKAKFVVSKAPNTLKAQAKAIKVKRSKVKKASVRIARANTFKVSGAQGKLTFQKISGSGAIKIAKNGNVTVGKGVGAKAYKVRVRVKAAGNTNYQAAAKTVVLKIAVK